MKAWVLEGIGDIRLESIDRPVPGKNEVLVNVKAAGICGSDVPRTYDTGAHKMPLVIGHEFSGVVVEAGPEDEAGLTSGWMNKRVGIFPLIPCKKCNPCQSGHYEMCRSYSYIGSRRNGAFAEYVTVPVWNLIELPEAVAFEEAAMLEPMSVAVHAMKIGLGKTEDISIEEKNDKAIVVCGLGTIGLLLVQFLLEAGFKNLYLIGNKELQKNLAVKIGVPAERFCDSKKDDAAQWLVQKTGGAAVFFECVGRNESISLAVDSVMPGGRVVLVGNPYGDITFPRNTYWKILRNQLTILGTWNSSFLGSGTMDEWHYVLNRLDSKQINPSVLITHRYPLENMDTGLKIMKNKSEEYCKIMIVNE